MTESFFRRVTLVLVLLITVTLMVIVNAFATNLASASAGTNTASVATVRASLTPVCPTSFTVNDNGDGADATPGDESCATAGAVCTLRAAIEEANALPACGVIDINFSGVPSPISLATALPSINHNININGPSANLLRVQRSTAGGTPNFRVFHINSGRTVTISGLTIANGNLITFEQNGAGVLNNGILTLTNCNIYGNNAGVAGSFGQGGGIYNSASLVLSNCNVGGIGAGQPNSAGASGGGVFSNGPLTMTGGSIVGNSGNGIAIGTGTTATLNSVAITNNSENGNGGAGIRSRGTANIANCLIANNTALGGSGGGILNGGTLTAVNSTVSSNGTIGSGGGIDNFNATTNLINVTITNNRVDTNNTGEYSSGGIHPAGGTVLLKNTIVAGNFRGSTGNTADDVTSPVSPSSSFNLIGACNGCGLSNGVNNNQVNVTNPYLAPLANNGGPTLTHALLFGSPAIDAAADVTALNGAIDSSMTTINVADASAFPTAIGFVIQIDDEQMIVTGKVSNTLTVSRGANSTVATTHNNMAAVNPAFDQRGLGFSRRLNAGIDIGAYESSKLEVNSLADTNDGACTDLGIGNGCTLREAITAANTRSGAESITFAPALTSGGAANIILVTALPDLSSEISIFGPGANRLTVARSSAGGTPNFRILSVQGGGTVAIYDLTIASGWLPNSVGGNIFNNGILLLTNCMVNGGSTGFGVGTGGGIFNNSGAILTLNNTTMTQNSANGGGAILNAGTLTMIDSKLLSNVSNTGGGGGIYSSGTITLSNSMVSGNFAQGAGAGAGIFNNGGTATLTNSTISGNTAGNGAGGIFNGGNLTLTNSTVSGNSSANIAGGLYCGAGTITLLNSTVTNNRSDSNNFGAETGGGIYRNSGTVTLNNTIVAGNFRGTGSTRDDINGAIDAASSNNLIGDGTGLTGISDGTNANLVGSSGSPINPMLGTLTNNGGLTLTHALISGSPAVDSGNNSAIINPPFTGPPFTDQRGGSFNRIADGDANGTIVVDMGAYELQGPLTIDNVIPKAGSTSGGQQIQLKGAFANLSTVTMGGTSATWSYSNGAADTSAITVTTPAHAVGAVQIDLAPTSGSPYSKPNAFAYLPTVFTDDTLVVGQTTAKAQHIIELRQAVDALRAVAGLAAATWTDPTLSPTTTIVKAVHIVELRSNLDNVATQLGYSTSPYTDASLGAGLVIKRIHIEELRQRIRNIAG